MATHHRGWPWKGKGSGDPQPAAVRRRDRGRFKPSDVQQRPQARRVPWSPRPGGGAGLGEPGEDLPTTGL